MNSSPPLKSWNEDPNPKKMSQEKKNLKNLIGPVNLLKKIKVLFLIFRRIALWWNI